MRAGEILDQGGKIPDAPGWWFGRLCDPGGSIEPRFLRQHGSTLCVILPSGQHDTLGRYEWLGPCRPEDARAALRLVGLEATVREVTKELIKIVGKLPQMAVNSQVYEPSIADYALHAKERFNWVVGASAADAALRERVEKRIEELEATRIHWSSAAFRPVQSIIAELRRLLEPDTR